MKKSAATRPRHARSEALPAVGDLRPLIAEVRRLIHSARHAAARTVNTLQVLTNFEIGRRIVEHEQKGEKRAEYGAELLKELSARLTEEFGKGFSPVNLSHMRRFFLTWNERIQIFQQPTEKLTLEEKSQQAIGKSAPVEIQQQPTAKSGGPFTLSWTHYVLLLTIKNPSERSFYEIEATNEGWSVPELKRQKASCLYERLASSTNGAAYDSPGQRPGSKGLGSKGNALGSRGNAPGPRPPPHRKP